MNDRPEVELSLDEVELAGDVGLVQRPELERCLGLPAISFGCVG